MAKNSRARGDREYYVVLRAVLWLSWSRAVNGQHPGVDNADLRGFCLKFGVSPAQVAMRRGLLAEDKLIINLRGGVTTPEAQEYFEQVKKERQETKAKLKAFVMDALAPLPLDPDAWFTEIQQSGSEWLVRLGSSYYGVPVNEFVLFCKLAHRGNVAMQESAADKKAGIKGDGAYVIAFTSQEVDALTDALQLVQSTPTNETVLQKLMNVTPRGG